MAAAAVHTSRSSLFGDDEFAEKKSKLKFALLLFAFCFVSAVLTAFVLSTQPTNQTADDQIHQDDIEYPWFLVHPHDEPKTFTEADAFCRLEYQKEGGRLAQVDDDEQDEEVAFKVKKFMRTHRDTTCKRFFVGYRVIASRKWGTANGHGFVAVLGVPYSRRFGDTSYDCFTMNSRNRNATTVRCTRKRVVHGICESIKDSCDGIKGIRSLENGCYDVVTNRKAATGEETAVEKATDFNGMQDLCYSSHKGRLAAFLDKVVPDKFWNALAEYIERNSLMGRDLVFAARQVFVAYEYETIYERRMLYVSKFLDPKPNADNCLAAVPGKEYKWTTIPCDSEECFVCTVDDPDPTFIEHEPPSENSQSDLL